MSRSLDKVHPELRTRLEKILAAMELLGFPMFVVSTTRTLEEQQALYAQGRTKPGQIVTYADGVRVKSNHQIQDDGWGYAVDCAFVDDPATPVVETWDEKQPWDLYGLMAEKLGLVWGGRWKRPVDKPHIELPRR